MANSTITATYMISGQYAGRVRITVNIGVGDPLNWGAYVQSKQDHGQGSGGFGGDYPYFVEKFTGSNTQTVYKTYSAGNYIVELALQGIGVVDYDAFTIPGAAPPPCQPNWQCRQPLDGYEHDVNNCGQVDRPNSACNPIQPPPSPPTLASITIPSTISVQVGKTNTISPVTCKNTSGSVMTCPTLTWGSGNNSIVTVSNQGIITGVSVGTMPVNCWDPVSGIASNLCQVTVTAIPSNGGIQCASDQMNIFGSCYKTSDIAIVAGAAVLLMILTRK